MNRMKRLGALLLLVLAAPACGGPKEKGPAFVPHPAGNGIWFSDGFGSLQDQAAVERSLSGAGLSWVLLPAVRLERSGLEWVVVKRAPPAKPFSSVPVSLVIEGGDGVAAALAAEDAGTRRSLENALGVAAKAALGDAARYGQVTGIHLDLPFTAATASRYGGILRRLRPRLPFRGTPSNTA